MAAKKKPKPKKAASKKTRTTKANKNKAPSTPSERDEVLEFLRQEILTPNNIKVDIDFINPQAYDKELDQFITKHKIKRDSVGRPTVMTVPTLQKLKMAFTIGCTDEEACNFAGISPGTLYNFQKKHEVFLELKDKWRDTQVVGARLNIFRSIMENRNVDDSWRYAKAKRKDEFSEKSIVQPLTAVTPDELEKISQGDFEAAKTDEE